MVAEHRAQEKPVETATGRGFELRELGGREHPRQVRGMPVLAVVRRSLTPCSEPAPHLADLVPLGDLDPACEQRKVLALCALGNERRHHESLLVVADHALHEPDVRVRMRGLLEVLDLLGRQLARLFAGRSPLDDPWAVLLGSGLVVGTARSASHSGISPRRSDLDAVRRTREGCRAVPLSAFSAGSAAYGSVRLL